MRYVLSEGSFCEYGTLDALISALRSKVREQKKEYKETISKKRQNHKDLIADVKISFYEGAKNE